MPMPPMGQRENRPPGTTAIDSGSLSALGLREHAFLAPDKLLQIPTEYELGLVRQITDCGHDMEHAMSVPSDVIELLDIIHRNFPILSRDETARAPPWFPSAVGVWPDMAAGVMLLAATRFSLIW